MKLLLFCLLATHIHAMKTYDFLAKTELTDSIQRVNASSHVDHVNKMVIEVRNDKHESITLTNDKGDIEILKGKTKKFVITDTAAKTLATTITVAGMTLTVKFNEKDAQ